MKPFAMVSCAALAIASITATACAQENSADQHVAFLWSAGGEGVSGAFNGPMSNGLTLGAGVQFPLPMRRLALRADVMYHWIYENDLVCIEQGCTDQDSHSHLISWSLDMVARLNDPVVRWSPYLIAGAALYSTGNSDEAITGMRTQFAGFQGGAGFEFRPRRTTMYIEYRYMHMAPGGVSPITMGFRF